MATLNGAVKEGTTVEMISQQRVKGWPGASLHEGEILQVEGIAGVKVQKQERACLIQKIVLNRKEIHRWPLWHEARV